MSSGLANWGDYGQSTGSGMVPGHSLGRGTGCTALGQARVSDVAEPQSRRGKEVQSDGGEQSVG